MLEEDETQRLGDLHPKKALMGPCRRAQDPYRGRFGCSGTVAAWHEAFFLAGDVCFLFYSGNVLDPKPRSALTSHITASLFLSFPFCCFLWQ